jgi:hypothetical protein
MRRTNTRRANVRDGARMTSAACSKAAVPAMSTDCCGVTAPTAAPTAAAAAGVCFERKKRNDDEHHRANASAGRQHRSHGAA